MKKLALLSILFLSSSSLYAQGVINPNWVDFNCSTDHNATVGTPPVPVVDHYDLNVIIGTPTGIISWTQGIGKPTPTAANLCSVLVPRLLTLSKGVYYATVAAVGVSGLSGVSAVSDSFTSTGSPIAPGKPSFRRE